MKIPWITSMPDHWEVHRAKNLFIKQNRDIRDKDDVVTCFRDGMVTLRKNRRTTGFTESTQWSGYQGIRKGDLVIHVMDAFAGAIGVSDSDGKSTPVYNVCTPKIELNNYYYAYLLREWRGQGLFNHYIGVLENVHRIFVLKYSLGCIYLSRPATNKTKSCVILTGKYRR